jgi:hypothetical protein
MAITTVIADYGNAKHKEAIEAMLVRVPVSPHAIGCPQTAWSSHSAPRSRQLEYSLHPMGGGEAIDSEKLSRVVGELAKRPYAFSVLAFGEDGRVAGFANCLEVK